MKSILKQTQRFFAAIPYLCCVQKNFSGFGSGAFPIFQGRNPADNHMGNPRRLLIGIEIGAAILHGVFVKNGKIRRFARRDYAAVGKAENLRRQSGHLIYRVLQRHQPVLTHRLEETGEGTVAARVHLYIHHSAVKRVVDAVTAHRNAHILHDAQHILLIQAEIVAGHGALALYQAPGRRFFGRAAQKL